MRIRAERAPGAQPRPPRRSRGLGLILGLLLGFVIALALPDGTLRLLSSILRNPGARLRAWQLRRVWPALEVDVDFESYQRWMRTVEAQRRGQVALSEADCVTVQLGGAAGGLSAMLCPAPAGLYAPLSSTPAFTVEPAAGARLMGMQSAILAPADPASVLGMGYLHTLAAEGLVVAERRFINVSVNGSGWGAYVLEAMPAEAAPAVMAASDAAAGLVLVTFDSTELPWPYPAVERSFAYARPVLTPLMPDAGEGAGAELVARSGAVIASLDSGAVTPSEVVDVQALARMVAATALWHGATELDWRTLGFAFDGATGLLIPLPAGWTPDAATPFLTPLMQHPAMQREIAVWMDRYSDPTVADLVLAGGDLETLFVALGGEPGTLRATLAGHQAAMRALVEPGRTLFATIADDPAGLSIDLRAILPFPVEVLGLDFGGQGYLAMDAAWVTGSDPAVLWSAAEGATVLAGRAGSAPVAASFAVPLRALPTDLQVGRGELSLVTRVWGLETSIPVAVDSSAAWRQP